MATTFSTNALCTGAGTIATIPMTISMLAGWKLSPKREKYLLLPREILSEVAERLGNEDDMTEAELTAITLVSHFGYGALTGSASTLVEQKITWRSWFKGTLAGLLIWIGSYLGWLPVVGILKPETEHPWRRNLIMILAHAVWGVALRETMKKLQSAKRYLDL